MSALHTYILIMDAAACTFIAANLLDAFWKTAP